MGRAKTGYCTECSKNFRIGDEIACNDGNIACMLTPVTEHYINSLVNHHHKSCQSPEILFFAFFDDEVLAREKTVSKIFEILSEHAKKRGAENLNRYSIVKGEEIKFVAEKTAVFREVN